MGARVFSGWTTLVDIQKADDAPIIYQRQSPSNFEAALTVADRVRKHPARTPARAGMRTEMCKDRRRKTCLDRRVWRAVPRGRRTSMPQAY